MSSINWDISVLPMHPHSLFYDCVSDLGLRQLVDKPTLGNNILDLVLVDDDRIVYNTRVLEPFSNSNHSMVTFTINLPIAVYGSVKKPYTLIDYPSLRHALNDVNWDNVLSIHTDVNNMWVAFHTVLSGAVAQSTFVRASKGRNSGYPWEALKLAAKKRKLWRKLKVCRDSNSQIAYNICRNKLTKCMRDHEVKKELKVLKDNNLSSLFRFIRSKTGSSRTIPPLNTSSVVLTSDLQKANAFNDAFSTNFVVDNGVDLVVPPRIDVLQDLDLTRFDGESVLKALLSLKNSQSVGPDGFSASFYRECAHALSHPLTLLFNCSLDSGKLPTCWKKARVVPIYKKGNAADPANYRPISLTCVPCKVMEKIIRGHMMDHLDEHKLLCSNQFGFLPGKSTTLQLLQCLDDWSRDIDSGSPVDLILVDFAKAFDSVVHSKLCTKLSSYGFNGPILNWIKDFLLDRSQSVCVGTATSIEKSVISGVPQGSVIGPLLFIIFINNLQCTSTAVEMPKYADDVKLYRAIVSNLDYRDLTEAVGQLEDWSSTYQLPIAAEKCSVLHFGRKNLKMDYSLHQNLLKKVTITKDLGVTFTSDLKMSHHCCTIVKTARQRAAMVRKCFLSKDTVNLVVAFKVYVRPVLEYASQVWSPYMLKDIDHVESVQRSFTKFLPGMRNKPYKERLRLLNLPSLELRRLHLDLALTFSLLHGLLDIDYRRFFTVRGCSKTRGHPLKLTVNKARTDCRKYYFANRVITPWNSLPSNVVTAPSLGTFKNLLRQINLSEYTSRHFDFDV
jgi:hypothetical protein